MGRGAARDAAAGDSVTSSAFRRKRGPVCGVGAAAITAQMDEASGRDRHAVAYVRAGSDEEASGLWTLWRRLHPQADPLSDEAWRTAHPEADAEWHDLFSFSLRQDDSA